MATPKFEKMKITNQCRQNLLVNDSLRRVGEIPTSADIFSNFSEYRFKDKNNILCFYPNSATPNFFKSLIIGNFKKPLVSREQLTTKTFK